MTRQQATTTRVQDHGEEPTTSITNDYYESAANDYGDASRNGEAVTEPLQQSMNFHDNEFAPVPQLGRGPPPTLQEELDHIILGGREEEPTASSNHDEEEDDMVPAMPMLSPPPPPVARITRGPPTLQEELNHIILGDDLTREDDVGAAVDIHASINHQQAPQENEKAAYELPPMTSLSENMQFTLGDPGTCNKGQGKSPSAVAKTSLRLSEVLASPSLSSVSSSCKAKKKSSAILLDGSSSEHSLLTLTTLNTSIHDELTRSKEMQTFPVPAELVSGASGHPSIPSSSLHSSTHHSATRGGVVALPFGSGGPPSSSLELAAANADYDSCGSDEDGLMAYIRASVRAVPVHPDEDATTHGEGDYSQSEASGAAPVVPLFSASTQGNEPLAVVDLIEDDDQEATRKSQQKSRRKLFGKGISKNECSSMASLPSFRWSNPKAKRIIFFSVLGAILLAAIILGVTLSLVLQKPNSASEPAAGSDSFSAAKTVTTSGGGVGNAGDDSTPIPASTCFTSRDELVGAVDTYLLNRDRNSNLSAVYGWPIGAWCVGYVTEFDMLFSPERHVKAEGFNEPLNSWNMSGAVSLQRMFLAASLFNQTLDQWDISRVKHLGQTFQGTSSFNHDITMWDTSNVVNMTDTFRNAAFNQPIGDSWNTSSVTMMQGMFRAAREFNQPLNWDVSRVTTLKQMFRLAAAFNQPLNGWDTSRVTSLEGTFWDASSFDMPLDKWNTSSVTTLKEVFRQATEFNQPLNAWDTSRVKTMELAFFKTQKFNQSLEFWDTSRVESFRLTFGHAQAFDQYLSNWNVSSAIDLQRMFWMSNAFRRDLCSWGPQLEQTQSQRLEDNDTAAPIDVFSMFFNATGCSMNDEADPNVTASPPGPFCHPCS